MISPFILACIGKLPSENWVPLKDFLLDLGQPWEPDPWECNDETKESVLVAVSQHINGLGKKMHSSLPVGALHPSAMRNLTRLGKMEFPNRRKNRLIEQFLFGCSGLPTGMRSLKNPRPNTHYLPIPLPCLRTN